MPQVLRRFRIFSPRELRLLGVAFHTVAWVRMMLWRQDADAVRAEIARQDAVMPASLADLREVVWTVRAAARLIPQATCLTQALAGQYLLARRGQVSTVRLSLPRGEAAQLRPHAWLMAGETIALGGDPTTYASHRPFLDYLPGSRETGLSHSSPEATQ